MSWLGFIDTSTGWILGWTIIHSLWQGAFVAAGLALVLRIVPGSMVRLRATLSWGAFALMLTLASGSWLLIEAEWRGHAACWDSEAYALRNAPLCAGHAVPAAREAIGRANGALNRTAVSWRERASFAARPFFLSTTGGVSVFALVAGSLALVAVCRFLLGVRLLRRIVSRALPPRDLVVLALAHRMRRELRVHAPVRIRVSRDISTPAVAGWRRPIILLPEGMAEMLEHTQLADVLAHELVHVRGRHFAVNLGQRVLDCVCMFNPFALWISGRIREEREVHCDRVAAGPLRAANRSYIETLLRLETMRGPTGPALIGLVGEGRLLRRVRRLLDTPSVSPRSRLRTASIAGLVSVALVVLMALVSVATVSITSWAVMSHDIQVRTAATATTTAARNSSERDAVPPFRSP